MSKFRRILALALCLALLGAALPVFAEEETAADAFDMQHLHVANPTPLTGHFFTSMWGASTSDLDVQELLHRYKLVVYDNELGRYRMNHLVVTGAVTQDDEEGNRTYYIALYEDLEYSDGTPITARDYAFTFLLMMDPAVAEAGGTPAREEWILGAEEYQAGEARVLAGVRIIDDALFSITVKKDALPYFYELSRFRVSPYPIHEIAPGCEVRDDGEGVYLTPGLTGELLKKTILDSYTGYMTSPKVVSGPYTIDSYKFGQAHFVLNHHYKGNQKGEIPAIPELTYGGATGEEMVEKMESGELGLLNKVTRAETVEAMFKLVGSNPGKYAMTGYPRTGLTVIRFMPHSSRIQETAVRKAIFYCLDRESIIRDLVDGYGLVIKGLYGVGQWMVRLLDEDADYPISVSENPTREEVRAYEKELEAWQSMNMSAVKDYTLDVEEAKHLLVGNGWVLDQNGDPYVSGTRYKRIETGQLLGLEMRIAVPAGMRETLEKHWQPYLEEAGIHLILEEREIGVLADDYRLIQAESELDMVLVGEDFTDQFLLSGAYRQLQLDPDPENDTLMEKVNKRVDQMNWEVYHTEMTDVRGFVSKWLALQVEIAESVPVIPLYSNVYFDFYRTELRDYRVEDYLGWGNAIVAAWLGEEPEITEEDAELLED